MNILFPTDFSSNARKGLDYTIDLVNTIGGTIHIITSFEDPRPTGSFVSIADVLRKDAENDMKILTDEVQERLSNDIVSYVAQSEPDYAVTTYASRNAIDLIVIPSKGMSNLENMILGSVTKKVIANSDTPVLVVPSNVKFNGTDPKILFAVDSKPILQTESTDLVIQLLQSLGVKIKFAHVNDKGEPINSELVKSIENIFTTKFEELIILEGTVPSVTITDYAFENDFDFVIMIKRKKSFLDKLLSTSQSSKGAGITKVPMIIIKE
jgi:nucleotide-binding universal stress UspA family protein